MPRTHFLGTGHFLPDKIVTNEDLAADLNTSDEWIRKRTGIEERRYVDFDKEPMGSSEMGSRAAAAALIDAGVAKEEIDCIIYATLSPDRQFPGDGVLVQQKLDIPAGVPAFDVRNQCSGFLYGLQMADAFIRQGIYRRILLIGAETHSSGLDFTERGRDVAVIFGDGAAAVVLGASEAGDASDADTQDSATSRGVLSVHLHADGRFADVLYDSYPSSARSPRVSLEVLPDPAIIFPLMQGKLVFKHAVSRMPEVVHEALDQNGLSIDAIDLLIPHQANLRICEMVQRRLGLPADKVFNNIQKHGNITAASIPLALHQACAAGKVTPGKLVCLVAFGAGFTWGAALIRW